MTLLAYQQALCDLVASPTLCLQVRKDAEAALAGYELSDRERRRLAAAARHRGMSPNCTLYRVNRITPIYSYLPLTCFLLGDSLIAEAERFWAEGKPADLQFGPETERFALYLKSRLASGALQDPYLEEILEFELAANRLRAASPAAGEALVRIVAFRHEPAAVLAPLSERRRPDHEPERGEFFLALDATNGEIALREIDSQAR